MALGQLAERRSLLAVMAIGLVDHLYAVGDGQILAGIREQVVSGPAEGVVLAGRDAHRRERAVADAAIAEGNPARLDHEPVVAVDEVHVTLLHAPAADRLVSRRPDVLRHGID